MALTNYGGSVAYLTPVTVGGGAALNKSEHKDMNMLIDTRNYFTLVFD